MAATMVDAPLRQADGRGVASPSDILLEVTMHHVSTFAASYAAGRGKSAVEVIAVVVTDGSGPESVLQFVVVDEMGRASLANAEDLDLYGVWLRAQNVEPGEDAASPSG